ncbi:MAG: hypothetical protein Fur0022_00070 [Anaerolineales bacterium]
MDRFGRRMGLSAGYALGAVGMVIAALSIGWGSFWELCLGAALSGMRRGSAEQSRFVAAEVETAGKRAKVIGLIIFAGTVGAIAGPQLIAPASYLAEQYSLTGAMGPYFLAAILLFLCVPLMLVFLRPDPLSLSRLVTATEIQSASETQMTSETQSDAPSETRLRSLRKIFSRPQVVLAVASMSISQLVMTAIMVITPLHMEHSAHTIVNISNVITAHTLGRFGLAMVTGRLVDRFGRIPIIVLGSYLIILATFIAPTSFGVWFSAIGLFLLGLGWNFCGSPQICGERKAKNGYVRRMSHHLLPSGLIRIAKDAARAAGRKAGYMVKRVTANTLSLLLGLPGMVVTEYALEKQEEACEILHIYCQPEHEIAQCPRCSQVSQEVHEETERSIRHLDIWGKITYVHFAARRFDCGNCKKPFTESLSWIEAKRRESSPYELHVYEQCKDTAIEAVAVKERLHPETVRLIFKRWAKRAEKEHVRPWVRCLGMDEISLRKGHQHFVLVLTDLERHCVIGVLEERTPKALEAWLDSLREAERKAIRLVAMDMWGPYRGVVRTKLPQAEVVADRFHVMKQLNAALAKIRRKLQSTVDPAGYALLKGLRWILVRHRAALKPEEELKLQKALSACPELCTVYLLKERFVAIAERIQNRVQAERFLQAWLL